jgi:hypothetical protein
MGMGMVYGEVIIEIAAQTPRPRPKACIGWLHVRALDTALVTVLLWSAKAHSSLPLVFSLKLADKNTNQTCSHTGPSEIWWHLFACCLRHRRQLVLSRKDLQHQAKTTPTPSDDNNKDQVLWTVQDP